MATTLQWPTGFCTPGGLRCPAREGYPWSVGDQKWVPIPPAFKPIQTWKVTFASAGAAVAIGALRRSKASCRTSWRGNRQGAEQPIIRACVVQDDEHARAVREWVNEFVVGLTFCPWAKPVNQSGGIRIVTSSATSADDVMRDLTSEAKLLRHDSMDTGDEAISETITTTLVACPYVSEWRVFDDFHLFCSHVLEDGNYFAEDFNLKVVSFHPNYSLYGLQSSGGDRIAVAGPDGEPVFGTLIDEDGGEHPDDGEHCVEVRFDDGQEFFVRASSIIGVMSTSPETVPNEQEEGEQGDAVNLVSRAPRPVLHLLRVEDLDHARHASQHGDGPNIEVVLQQNERRAEELGITGVSDILRRCG